MSPQELLAAFAAPFDPAAISWRVGSTNKKKFEAKSAEKRRGQVLAYLDARDVQRRLDEVAAADWQCRFSSMPNGTMCCEIGIRFNGEWVWRANGAGSVGNVRGDDDREMQEKAIYSDALKRAAVMWGIGRYLYDIDSPWIELDDFWGIPRNELPKLRALLPGAPNAPARSGKSAYREDWAQLAAELRTFTNLVDVDQFLADNKSSLERMPIDWKPKWNDLVAQVRGAIQQLAA